MSTTPQNQEQSNMSDYSYRYTFSPRKQRWLLDGETEPLTFNQLMRLGNIAEQLGQELYEPYSSEVLTELKDILIRLYAIMEGNSNG